jgi:hypothetical protein
MTKIPTLARAASGLCTALALTVLMSVTPGCHSSSPDLPPLPAAGNPPQPADPIEGVATPSSVALVTATNAQ